MPKTRNISMGELDGFAQADAQAQGFDSMSEYFRSLVRERRQRLIAEDLAFLTKAARDLPEEEPSQEFFDDLARVKRELRAEQRKARR